MDNTVPFIGRKKEFDLISKEILDWNALSVFCLEAVGGIGKTRILQEIPRYFSDILQKELYEVLPIIDFDDRKHLDENNIWREIANRLGRKGFTNFFKLDSEFIDIEKQARPLEERIQKNRQRMASFIESFNEISLEKRIIIRFDTIEEQESSSLFDDFLNHPDKKPKNCLFIVTGRDANKICRHLSETGMKDNVENHTMEAFPDNSIQEYIKYKEKQVQIRMDEDTRKKIEILSGGKPILIDMAFDWSFRVFPPEWLKKYTDLELKTILEGKNKNEETVEEITGKFEYDLVRELGKWGIDLDDLVLLLSRVYPLNAPMIAFFLDMDEKKAEALLNEAKKKVFIKALPGDQIKLHDELKRIVNLRFWPERDPESLDVTEYHRQAVRYFQEQIREYEDEKKSDKSPAGPRDFNKEEIEFAILLRRMLLHLLQTDLEAGYEFFIQRFDEAWINNENTRMHYLCINIDLKEKRYPEHKRFEIDERRARYYMSRGRYKDAENVIAETMKTPDLHPSRLAELLIISGNTRIRNADYTGGIEHFRKAVEVCGESDLGNEQAHMNLKMRSHLALGWGYRLLNNYADALIEYDKALEMSIDLGDKMAEAKTLNNKCFVLCREGNITGALRLQKESWKILETLHQSINDYDKTQKMELHETIGSYYHVMAEISLHEDENEGISYIKQALEIFAETGNMDWYYRMECLKGKIYWLIVENSILDGLPSNWYTNLEKSVNALELVLEKASGRNRINASHYLGHTYLTWSELDTAKADELREKALRYFENAYNEAKETSNNSLELNSMGDMARIAILNGDFSKLHEYEDIYEKFLSTWASYGYGRIEEGLLLKYLGDGAIEINPPDFEKAARHYIKSIRLIGLHGYVRPYSLPYPLYDIDQRLNRKITENKTYEKGFINLKQELGKTLYHIWKENNRLNTSHPESLNIFIAWRKG